PCQISRQYDPVAEFLQLRARSPFAAEAVRRANEAFTTSLANIPELVVSSERFPSEEVQGTLSQYEALAERLPVALRASASVTIADLWVRFRRYDRARALYRWLLAAAPAGIDTTSVRQRLQALPT
ncbi:MAG TPA: hypothetical protein VHO95_11390, partial [Candidatus Dormibacteraeota bacterium]|nr:hypothetical protein [Candidatus Dormibacteraeota bacterium]